MDEASNHLGAERQVSRHLQLSGSRLLELFMGEPGLFREVVLEPGRHHLIGVSLAGKQDGGKDWDGACCVCPRALRQACWEVLLAGRLGLLPGGQLCNGEPSWVHDCSSPTAHSNVQVVAKSWGYGF